MLDTEMGWSLLVLLIEFIVAFWLAIRAGKAADKKDWGMAVRLGLFAIIVAILASTML